MVRVIVGDAAEQRGLGVAGGERAQRLESRVRLAGIDEPARLVESRHPRIGPARGEVERHC